MEDLTGKVAIVTGASSGIGEAIARLLVVVGVHVIGLARSRKDLQAVAKSLKGEKGTFHAFPGDVRIEEDILNVFAYADHKYGGIDILVNDAGLGYVEYVTNSSTHDLRNILYTNTLAAAITNREAVQYMVKRKIPGHIVNIVRTDQMKILEKIRHNQDNIRNALHEFQINLNKLTIGGLQTGGFKYPLSIYGSSKFALRAITENVRQEITQKLYPIKVTGIYPQTVKTPFYEKAGYPENYLETVPYLEPQDIADAVLYALEVPRNIQINRVVITAMS